MVNEQSRQAAGEGRAALDPSATNTELWTAYLRGQMRTLIDPFGLAPGENVDAIARPLADMTAAIVSGWTSLLFGGSVRAMYRANATEVTRFIQEQAIDKDAIEIPVQYAAPRPLAPTQIEEWAMAPAGDRELSLAR
jgi:hypothetical protein